MEENSDSRKILRNIKFFGEDRGPKVPVLSQNWPKPPSPAWRTSMQSAFGDVFIPRPPRALPPVIRLDESRKHNPHAQNAFHVNDFGKKKYCNVSTESSTIPHFEIPVSTTQGTYVPTRITTYIWKRRPPPQQPASGMVPFDKSHSARLLPAMNSNKLLTMATRTSLQYTGRRKLLGQPFKDTFRDAGVFIQRESPPATNGPFWGSLNSLSGNSFSRKRLIFHPQASFKRLGSSDVWDQRNASGNNESE